MFNVENWGMDKFFTFHQEKHSKKTCPQWNHNMNSMMTNFVDTLLAYEKSKQTKEANESTITEESLGVGNLVNAFGILHNYNKQSANEPPLSGAPP